MTEKQESGSTERRYGGTPSGPGDFFRADRASARSSLKLGGGTSCGASLPAAFLLSGGNVV